jgi:hypothetical protein
MALVWLTTKTSLEVNIDDESLHYLLEAAEEDQQRGKHYGVDIKY